MQNVNAIVPIQTGSSNWMMPRSELKTQCSVEDWRGKWVGGKRGIRVILLDILQKSGVFYVYAL
jgi:hypothetical protein